jgi:hypothetical protein
LLLPADLLLDLLALLLVDFEERVLEAFASDRLEREPSPALDRLEDPRSLEAAGFLEDADPDAFDDPGRREPALRAEDRPEPASLALFLLTRRADMTNPSADGEEERNKRNLTRPGCQSPRQSQPL